MNRNRKLDNTTSLQCSLTVRRCQLDQTLKSYLSVPQSDFNQVVLQFQNIREHPSLQFKCAEVLLALPSCYLQKQNIQYSKSEREFYFTKVFQSVAQFQKDQTHSRQQFLYSSKNKWNAIDNFDFETAICRLKLMQFQRRIKVYLYQTQ